MYNSDTNAGRELDVLIDTKVMGRREQWAVFFGGSCYGDGLTKEAAEVIAVKVQGDYKAQIINYYDVPHYSTSIAAAWLVVEKLRKTHCCLTLRSDFDYLWECYAIKDPDDLEHKSEVIVNYKIYAMSEVSAPHAICLAALKAVGYKERTDETD